MTAPLILKAKRVLRHMRSADKIFFFDFDGTLSIIVDNPPDSKPSAGAEGILEEITRIGGCFVCVISGRKISDIKKRLRVKNAIYCGNHGAEIEGRGMDFKYKMTAVQKRDLKQASAYVENVFGGVPGFIKEYKGYAAAFHYRKVKPEYSRRIERWFIDTGKNGLAGIRIRKGKKVFELLPEKFWGKADAVKLISAKFGIPKAGIFFAGDDTTDIETFHLLGKTPFKLFVGGKKEQGADLYLKNPEELIRFLEILVPMIKEEKHGRDNS